MDISEALEAVEASVERDQRECRVRTDTAPFGMGRPVFEVVESRTTTPRT
jgi:hypothetical protein